MLLTVDSPVLLAVICFGTLASFTFITLGQKQRNNFVTYKMVQWQYGHILVRHRWGEGLKKQKAKSCCGLNDAPEENLPTSGPTLSTIPAASWPRTDGNGLNLRALLI